MKCVFDPPLSLQFHPDKTDRHSHTLCVEMIDGADWMYLGNAEILSF